MLVSMQCPELIMEPLGLHVRDLVISAFIEKYGSKLKLDDKQHFRIVTARATSQPLFLRMLLYALKLGVDVSETSIDAQLDLYLNKVRDVKENTSTAPFSSGGRND